MKSRTIKVTTDNLIQEIEINFSDYRSLKEAIGGYFETVHTQKMHDYFKGSMMLLVDEEGHLKNLPSNRLGSFFYDTEQHGWPIAGDIIFAVSEGPDIVAPKDVDELKRRLLKDFPYLYEVDSEQDI